MPFFSSPSSRDSKPGKLRKRPPPEVIAAFERRAALDRPGADTSTIYGLSALQRALNASLLDRPPPVPPRSRSPDPCSSDEDEPRLPSRGPFVCTTIAEPSTMLMTEYLLGLVDGAALKERDDELGELDEGTRRELDDALDAFRDTDQRYESALETLAEHHAATQVRAARRPHLRADSMPIVPPRPPPKLHQPLRSQSMPATSSTSFAEFEEVDAHLLMRFALVEVQSVQGRLLECIGKLLRTLGLREVAYDPHVVTTAQHLLAAYAFMLDSVELRILRISAQRLSASLADVRRREQALVPTLVAFDEAYTSFERACRQHESETPRRRRRERLREQTRQKLASKSCTLTYDVELAIDSILSTSQLLASSMERAQGMGLISRQELLDLDPHVFVALPRLTFLFGARYAVMPALWDLDAEKPLEVFLPRICASIMERELVSSIRGLEDTSFKRLARLLAGSAWPGYFAGEEVEILYRTLATLVDGETLGHKKTWSAILSKALTRYAVMDDSRDI